MSADRPWEADRILTVDAARAAIGSQFPGVDPRRLEHLGSGWEFDAYLTHDGWVFRFPRRAEYAAIFDREPAVLRLVANRLQPVAVPNVELLGRPGPHFPYAFRGHHIVPGVCADQVNLPLGQTLAEELGVALSAIHSVPEAEARAAGVAPDEDGSREWLEEARQVATRLRGTEPSLERALDWLQGVTEVPDPYTGPLRFVHNDLCPDHLLVDPDSGCLLGIIDWTDAALGDPALDFAVLVTWRGWGFARDALAAYRLPMDAGLGGRLSFLARVLSLVWLFESREQGTDVAKHLRWVRNAFAGP